jgi:hypothetical protein
LCGLSDEKRERLETLEGRRRAVELPVAIIAIWW